MKKGISFCGYTDTRWKSKKKRERKIRPFIIPLLKTTVFAHMLTCIRYNTPIYGLSKRKLFVDCFWTNKNSEWWNRNYIICIRLRGFRAYDRNVLSLWWWKLLITAYSIKKSPLSISSSVKNSEPWKRTLIQGTQADFSHV